MTKKLALRRRRLCGLAPAAKFERPICHALVRCLKSA